MTSNTLEYGFRHGTAALALAAALSLGAASAGAQTYGFATLQPGTLNHTSASAIAKVLKEKAGLNVLVQPTAGDNVIIPMVNKAEVEIGIANAPELHNAFEGAGVGGKQTELRIIATAHPLRSAFWVRKAAPMRTIADLKGKRVLFGYSAMRVLDGLGRAILATGGLTETDVQAVLVPNVIRGADDFIAGNADMYFFENCRVPVANRIGAEGDGFKIAMAGLDGGRLNIAACSIGGAQFCLDRTIAYMRERKQFGSRLSDFQALRFRVADYATDSKPRA